VQALRETARARPDFEHTAARTDEAFEVDGMNVLLDCGQSLLVMAMPFAFTQFIEECADGVRIVGSQLAA
jgi:hypothetical protein